MGLASFDVLGAHAFSDRLLTNSLFSAGQKPAVKLPEPASPPPSLPSQSAPSQEEAFEAVTYFSKVQRMSLMAQFQQASVQAVQDGGEGGGTAVSAQAQQLSFDFFFESREESLAVFSQRTGQVADGLEGARQESYVAASQQVAARFQFSVSISGAALGGFAGASESLQDTGELFDQLIAFTNKLLEAGDEWLNEFLSALNGTHTDEEQFSFEDLFQRMVEEFLGGINAQFQGLNTGGEGAQFASAQLEFSFEFSAEVTIQQGVVQQSDPIILDLDGDGFELSHYRQGANFDILGTGAPVQTAFVTGGDAFLALDRNGDGVINSGQELFGDQHGAVNGYEELRKLDDNQDGVIDQQDAVFSQLRLFRDNGNGQTEAGELLTLAEAGVAEISLNYRNVDEVTSGDNRMAQLASYKRTDGSYGNAGDAILNYLA